MTDGIPSTPDAGRPDGASLDALIDRDLAGTLSAAERAELDRLAADDPGVRHTLQQQHAIQNRLRASFRPPARLGEQGEAPTLRHRARRAGARTPGRRLLALGGVGVALALGAAWLYLAAPPPTPTPAPATPAGRPHRPVALGELYREAAEMDFEPGFVCTTDAEFARVMDEFLGEPMIVAAADGVEVLGWRGLYSPLAPYYQGDPLVLMLRVNGRGVLVVMDRQNGHPSLGHVQDPELRQFERQTDGLRLIEITPLQEPRVLELFEPPPPGLGADAADATPEPNDPSADVLQ